MNLLARLGILFFTQTEKAAKGITELEKRLDQLREKSKVVRTKAMDSAGNSVRNLTQQFDNLSSAASSGINLSSSLDSTYAQFDKTAQRLAGTMGVSAKAIKQQAGFFYDLNLNGDEWLQTSAMMQKFKLDPKRMGVGSLKEYAKALDVVGASGPELTKTLLGVRQNFNQTDEELGQLLDDVALIGKRFGSSSEFVGQFGTVAGALNEQLRKIDPTADAKKYRDYAQQIYLVAGALQETVNADPATALSSSVELFGKLADTQADFESLFAGAGNGVPELMNQVAMAMGGFDEIKASPLKFVEAISTAYAQASDEQRFFMRKQLTNTFGADLDYLFQGDFGKVAGKIKDVTAEVDKSTGSFKELAKSFRTGFTQQDLYNRAAEKFEHRLTGMARSMGIQSKILANQKVAYKKTGDALEGLVSRSLTYEKALDGVIGVKGKGLTGFEASLKKAKEEGRPLSDEMSLTERAAGRLARAFLAYRVGGVQGLAADMVNATDIMSAMNKVTDLTGLKFKSSEEEVAGYATTMAALAPDALAGAEALNRAGINFQNLGAMASLAMIPLKLFNSMLFGLPGGILKVLGPLGLLAGAGFLIYKNWDKGLDKWFKKTWGNMEKKVTELAPVVKKGLLSAMEKATAYLNSADTTGAGEQFAVFMGKVFDATAGFMGDALGGLYNSLFGDEEASKKAAGTAGESLGRAFGDLTGAAVAALGRGLAGFLGKGLDYLVSDAPLQEKAGTVGKMLAGAIGTGLALRIGGAVTGSSMMSGLGRALMLPGTMAAGAAAKGSGSMLNKLRGGAGGAPSAGAPAAPGRAAKFGAKMRGGIGKIGAGGMAKGLTTVAGLYAFVTEGPAAFESAFDMILTGSTMSYEKLTETGFKMASGFAKIVDTIFMGIPSTILKWLGVGEKEFKIFYNELVTETSIRISQVIMYFKRLGIDAARTFEAATWVAKDFQLVMKEVGASIGQRLGVSIGGLFGDMEDNLIKGRLKFQTFFDGIRSSGEMVFSGLKFTLRDFATNVLDEYLGPVLQRLEDVSVNALRLAKKLGVPTGGLNENDLRLASKLGLDAAGIEARRRSQAKQLADEMRASSDGQLSRMKQFGLQAGVPVEDLKKITTVDQMQKYLETFSPGRGDSYRAAITASSQKVIDQIKNERVNLTSQQIKMQAELEREDQRLLGEQRLFETTERAAATDYARGLYAASAPSTTASAPAPAAQVTPIAPKMTPKATAPKAPAQIAEKKKAGIGDLTNVSSMGFKGMQERLDLLIEAVKKNGGMKPKGKSGGDAEMYGG